VGIVEPQPDVLVGLGGAATAVRDRCRRAGLALLLDEHDLVVHLRRKPLPYWQTRDAVAYTWGDTALARGTHPDEVRLRYEAPGVVVRPSRAAVHAGRIGAYPVLARPIDGGWAVSDAAPPLEALDTGALQPDWTGWAAQMTFRATVGSHTATQGTTRLGWGEALVLDRRDGSVRRVRRHSPVVTDRGVQPEHVVDALLAAVQRLPPHLPVDLPLSAGWDSRALALALHRVGRPFHAWTIEKPNGRGVEVPGAQSVARALGVPHQVLRGDAQSLADARTAALRRTSYLTTLHAWILPLLDEVRERGGVVPDGLLGDTLLRSLSARRSVLLRDPAAAQRQALRQSYTDRVPAGVLGPGGRRWVDRAARRAYASTVRPLLDSPDEFTQVGLVVRGASAVAPAPLMLTRRPALVSLPFLDPDVVDLALAVPVERKVDLSFYREVLALLHPEVGPLPSDTDGPKAPATAPRLATAEVSLDWYRPPLARVAEVPGLLDDDVRRLVTGSAQTLREWLTSGPVAQAWLAGAAGLGLWLLDHDGRLADVRPPWV
jgi:hypothetical protein